MNFISKEQNNKFNSIVNVKNNNINIKNIINHTIINVIYEINKNTIFSDYSCCVNEKNPKKITIVLLLKHFFKDFGITQKYVHLDIEFEDEYESKIVVHATTAKNNPKILNNMFEKCDLVLIDDVKITCNIKTPHDISFESTINFNIVNEIPDYIEKMACTIINKIFLRTKQFIENMHI